MDNHHPNILLHRHNNKLHINDVMEHHKTPMAISWFT